jgi:hypothetical protein
VLGYFNMDRVSQVVCGSSEFLQGFPDELGPYFHLRVERFFQVVVTIAILKCPGNLFLRRSGRDTI